MNVAELREIPAVAGYHLVGKSLAWQGVLEEIDLLSGAPSSTTVLILGESGTGKEEVAKAIHGQSNRAQYPFVAMNCAAIPHDLLESILFGYEKGAFTGAQAARPGKFEQAHSGTLFLDEIGDMPLALQAKVLRVLQERQVERVGGKKPIPIDVRVVAATHQDLEELVVEGRFRADLYYRLHVYPIVLPPLRERAGDVPILVEYFVAALAKKEGGAALAGHLFFLAEAMEAMCAYPWPGNVRELRNLVERMSIKALKTGGVVRLEDVRGHLRTNSALVPDEAMPASRPGRFDQGHLRPEQGAPGRSGGGPIPRLHTACTGLQVDLRRVLAETEVRYLREALAATGGSVTQAAEYLGLQRTTLVAKLKKYKLHT